MKKIIPLTITALSFLALAGCTQTTYVNTQPPEVQSTAISQSEVVVIQETVPVDNDAVTVDTTKATATSAAVNATSTTVRNETAAPGGNVVQEVHIVVEQAAVSTSTATAVSEQTQVQEQAQQQVQEQTQVQIQQQEIKPKLDADGYEIILDDLN